MNDSIPLTVRDDFTEIFQTGVTRRLAVIAAPLLQIICAGVFVLVLRASVEHVVTGHVVTVVLAAGIIGIIALAGI